MEDKTQDTHAENKQEGDKEEVKVSDAFLNLDLKQPSYAGNLKNKEVKPKKQENKKEDDDDEFERDEDYGEENANVDEDDKGASFEQDKKSNKVSLKVNINVTNISKKAKQTKIEETKEYTGDNKLLDMLFSFIGASSERD